MTSTERSEAKINRYETALKTILDEAATDCEGHETLIVKTAREALGISKEEYWGIEGSE